MLPPEDRMTERWTRREILGGSLRAGVALAAGRFFVTELDAQPSANPSLEPAFRALDTFVREYMRMMDAPGMTLVIANRSGIIRAATYGFSDVDRSAPVNTDQL